MRVLLDENPPLDLAFELRGHDVHTVSGLGWAGMTNGDLVRRAAGRQRISTLSFIFVRAASNRMIHLRPLVPALLAAIESVTPGHLRQVSV